MKTLILGPLNYDDVRKDLQLINYKNNVSSIYFVLEGLIANLYRIGQKEINSTALSLFLAEGMSDKEYETFDIVYGLAPKSRHFDRVICYNYDVLEIQEKEISDHYEPFEDKFWTTADVTDVYPNIMEMIKDVFEQPATPSN